MINFYNTLLRFAKPLLEALLKRRAAAGKEDPARLGERMGRPGRPRPDGPLAWFHAASVGEVQSALILIDALKRAAPALNILITTGTVTSAALVEKRLGGHVMHQFYPLDHPGWVRAFLDHWKPSIVFWMESELWPGMLNEVRVRRIPALLVNARLSLKSYSRWRYADALARHVLSGFALIITQTKRDASFFKALGAQNVVASGNIKYCADPLPCDPQDLARLKAATGARPKWVYASTHKGEEALACRLHARLQSRFPDLLTVIVPRHPARGAEALQICRDHKLSARLRSADMQDGPAPSDQIYIADTLGELGLFYTLCPVACIGRTFSDDGGGGHNPIEAAQLGCAVLHGPNVRNLQEIFDEMDESGAAVKIRDEKMFEAGLAAYLGEPDKLAARRDKALAFAAERSGILERVCGLIKPHLVAANIIRGDQEL